MWDEEVMEVFVEVGDVCEVTIGTVRARRGAGRGKREEQRDAVGMIVEIGIF